MTKKVIVDWEKLPRIIRKATTLGQISDLEQDQLIAAFEEDPDRYFALRDPIRAEEVKKMRFEFNEN